MKTHFSNGRASRSGYPLDPLRSPTENFLAQTRTAHAVAELESGDGASIQILICWGDSVVHVAHLTPPRSFHVGERRPNSQTPCDYFMPEELLGAKLLQVIRIDGRDAILVVPRGSTGTVQLRDQQPESIGSLVDSGAVRTSDVLAGACELVLPLGAVAELQLPGGMFTFRVSVVNAVQPVLTRCFQAPGDLALAVYTCLSLLLHVGVLAIVAFLMPHMEGDDGETIESDRTLLMQRLLSAAAERETQSQPETAETAEDPEQAGRGQRGTNAEGQGRDVPARDRGHTPAVAPVNPAPDPYLARQRALTESTAFGAIGLLRGLTAGDHGAPSAVWGSEAPSGNDTSAFGGFLGSENGGVTGSGVLGLIGGEEGGGGAGARVIGLENISSLGGLTGVGEGRAPLTRRPGGIAMPRQASVQVNGRLPGEVIQRVVRLNQGRYRLCYENGLRQNPTLRGRVAIKFVIDRTGAVVLAADGGSDLPDSGVVSCIVGSFRNLSFPSPEGGMVTVTYPIVFTAPSDR